MRPKVRILLPIWGADYISSFEFYGLRSLLAPGNIPAMASRCDTEFVFLTPARDHKQLQDSPFVQQLQQVCQVTFLPIDDLLLDNMLYGYTLTYAYHRGIISAGDRLKDTHFVFIVSDYVFSENSFDSLSRKIVAGHRVILSGSLRVDNVAMDPYLREMAKPDEPLCVPARRAVDLSLRTLHPSLETKIVNRPEAGNYSSNFQHFYWRVYPKTLISRNFMAHMLCINPEFCPPQPRGFCDYTFIPDMAPGAPYAWLDDSDDYFAMELQHPEHERHFTQKVARSECPAHHVAKSLSEWTTAQHRSMADHTFIYHAGPIPDEATLAKVQAEADAFIDEVKYHLAPEPVSHLNHPHWEDICVMIVEGTQRRWHKRNSEPADPNRRKFNFAMSVWGMRYVDILLKVGLPSQLSPGNLQSFPWLDDSVYEIYTTRHDSGYIRGSRAYRFLSAFIEVRIIYIDDAMTDGKWGNVRHCHREAVKSADARGAAVFFLCPDQVWPDGSLTRAGRLIDQGYSAVMCPGPRAIEEDVMPLLRQRYLSSNELSLSVTARDLVKVGLEHAHREMREWTWDAPEYFGYPTYVLFDVPGEGVLAHCYVLHPVVVNPEVRNAVFDHVFDQDYLMNACPDVSKIYVAEDSDEVFHFELSPRNTVLPPPARLVTNRDPEAELMWYGEKQYNAHHRYFAKRPIRIHYKPINEDAWRPIEERAWGIIKRIDEGLTASDAELLRLRPDQLIRRMEKRYPDWLSEISPEDQLLWDEAREMVERKQEAERQSPFPVARAPMANFANEWIAIPGRNGGLAALTIGGQRSDPNAGGVISTRGTGKLYFNSESSTQFAIASTPGAVNFLSVAGTPGDSPPILFPDGAASRLGMQLASKNGGTIYIGGTDDTTATLAVETGAVTVRGHQRKSAAEGLAARGSDRQTALLLTCDINHVASTAANGGVLLPAAKAGASVVVVNGADQPIRVYASGLDDVDAERGTVGRSMQPGACIEYVCIRDHDWVSVELGSVAKRKLAWRSLTERMAEVMGAFDRAYYLRNNPDVAAAGVDPERHYHEYGWKEGRDPSPYFSVQGDLATKPDVAAAELEPLGHFVRHGIGEGRQGWQKPFAEQEVADAATPASASAANQPSFVASLLQRLTGRR